MDEKNLEESGTSENTHEEESTSTNDESTEYGVEDEQIGDLAEKNRQLYARARKAEAERKKMEALLHAERATKQESKPVPASGDNTPDVFELAKQISALKDYSSEELEIIDRQAKAFGLSHLEASKHEDVQTLISAKRAKLKEVNSVPTPSTRQSLESIDISSLTARDIANLKPNSNPQDAELIKRYNELHRKGGRQ